MSGITIEKYECNGDRIVRREGLDGLGRVRKSAEYLNREADRCEGSWNP